MGRLANRHLKDVVVGDTTFVIRPVFSGELIFELGLTPEMFGEGKQIAESFKEGEAPTQEQLELVKKGLELRNHILCKGVVGIREDGALQSVELVLGDPVLNEEDGIDSLTAEEQRVLFEAIQEVSGAMPAVKSEELPGEQVAGDVSSAGQDVPAAPS